ncbi:HrgA protein [Helicobacter cinaedi]|uniref:HTH domain-containing protein n=1 Tax=Helicobacter cinaedi TaxID=213 RepID=UPI001EED7B69|nr:HTH domain-containing protein [Helicobacter cinaedi]BDB66305.1 HrgA protein [Helicobacter cinaedi]
MQKKMTYLEVAKAVLENATTPLKATQIWDIAVEKGLNGNLTGFGKLPPQTTMGLQLYVDIRDKQDSIFIKASSKPTTFWLRARQNELQKGLESMQESKANSQKQKGRGFHERDLHPLFVRFAKDYFDVYAKTIKHEKSKKTQSGQDKWNYPDIVGVHFPFNDYSERETLELSQNLNRRDFKIYSFELKVSLDFSNLKESYFQAVSNSSFANEGYLVVFEELDSEVFDELRRLHSSFGIGLIKLELEPTESSVLLPSLVRNLDFRTIDMLVNKNADFREFIDTINGDIQTNDKRRIALQYYDRVLDDESLDRYLSEKGLRG